MKAILNNVLIEETLTKTNSLILGLDKDLKSDDRYESKKVVLKVGSNVSDVAEGDEVVFSKYANPSYEEITSGKVGDAVITRLLVVPEDLIVLVK